MAPPLARTSSVSSVESVDTAAEDGARRTRKRFNNVQLMYLEHLFHQTSHPTREQREALARESGMDTRAVTVWFQNKRQTERKIARAVEPYPGYRDLCTLFSTSASALSRPRTPTPTAPTRRASFAIPARTLSLDHIAARAERPPPRTPPHAPSTPTPASAPLWAAMPSSPSASPPREPAYAFSGRRRRTLEWACAAARPGDREGEDEGEWSRGEVDAPLEELVLDVGGDTEDEAEGDAHEALTPQGSFAGTQGWAPVSRQMKNNSRDGNVRVRAGHDEDMIDAALVLCGLGRR